jgi:hypothetical protein
MSMSIEAIGCCGAYCGTCRVIKEGACRGCKMGYLSGERDLALAKCKMKVCCITKRYASCADCDDYSTCDVLQGFFGKNGYKYKKYREALEFIREDGYDAFLAIADGWTNQYGKYR